MRCFLALPLADPALTAAARLQGALSSRVADVRWARPETLHVTVHFFGEIDDERVAVAVDAVLPLAADTETFAMALDSLGSFPPAGTPRVLWLGQSAENAALTALAGRCQAALRDGGFPVNVRPYRPHCTLGRPSRRWGAEGRAAWSSARAEQPEVMRWTATRLVLYDSRSARGGAVYTEQAVLPFAAH
ncbi:MAG: RNA 2',3'-cyclic phosphodiesterase [Candidatus Dormiibacterota bacterium]